MFSLLIVCLAIVFFTLSVTIETCKIQRKFDIYSALTILLMCLLIVMYFVTALINWAPVCLCDEINRPLYELGAELRQVKNNSVKTVPTLDETGWSYGLWGKPAVHPEKLRLFERFISKYPHLEAFSSYYKMGNSLKISGHMKDVRLTGYLIYSLQNCNDLTI